MSDDRKQCEGCTAIIERPPGKCPAQWKRRRFCCHGCGLRAAAAKKPDWRATEKKTCPVCEQVFRPSPRMRPRLWKEKTICDRFCGAAYSHERRVVMVDPLDQKEPYQRLKWLRLSASKCGKKEPWSLETMSVSAGCKA